MNPAQAKSRLIYKHDGTLYAMAIDRTARRLYAGSSDYAVHVFDLPAESAKPETAQNNNAKSGATKDDGKQASKTAATKAAPTKPAEGKAVSQWTKHENYVSALAFLAPSRALVSGGYDGKLVWWDAASGNVKHSVAAHTGWVRAIAATPDGGVVISAGDDMLIKLWDASSGKLLHTLEGHAKLTPQQFPTALYALSVSADGKFLASADRIGAVRVWEIASGKTVQQFQVPILYTFDPRQRKRSIGGIRAAAFSPDGKHLAVGGIGQVGNVDGFEGPAHVELWDWQQPRKVFAAGLEGQKGIINHLAFDPRGEWLVGGGGGNGGLLGFWKVNPLPQLPAEGAKPGGATAKDGQKPKESKEPEVTTQRVKFDGHIHDFSFNADGTELYAAGHGKLEVWTLS